MLLRRSAAAGALVFFVLLFANAARAQFAVYDGVTGERVGGFTCTDSLGCAAGGGAVRPYGGTFGTYYDFRSIGPIRLGVDFRGGVLNSNKSATTDTASTDLVRHYSALGGLRAGIHVPFTWLHPYAQISAGYGHSNAASTNPRLYNNYTQVQGFVGADITLLPVLDLRAIELGAGEMFGSSSHSIQSIGIGVVFHTPRRRHY